jgi:hypothetical protein
MASEEAREVVLIANEFKDRGVVGIDFSGNPLLVRCPRPLSCTGGGVVSHGWATRAAGQFCGFHSGAGGG